MLYLIRPDFRVEWDNVSSRAAISAAAEHGADLAGLDWKPAEEVGYSDQLLTVALSRGTACSAGLVLRGTDVSVLTRPARLYETATEAEQAHARLRSSESFRRTENFLEAQMPGWKAHGEETDRAVSESVKASISEAMQEAEDLLSQPSQDELVHHWEKLGGRLPD